MVLGVVQGLPPQDAPSAVGATLLPVLLRVGVLGGRFCSACSAFNRKYPAGICAGCGRQAAISRGHCRLCHCQAQYLAASSPWDTGPQHFHELGPGCHQLFFANMVAVSRGRRRRQLSPGPPVLPPGPDGLARAASRTTAARAVHAAIRGCPWRILAGDWPRLSWYECLAPAVARIGERHGWSPHVQEHVRNTLRSLIATQPSDARTYPASAVQRLRTGRHHSAARTLELLADLRLLAEDRPDPGDIWAGKRLDRLPPAIRKDVEPWLDQIRHGDARHRPKAAGTWRGYCTAIIPALLAWAQDHGTLRDITRDDIIAALTQPSPHGGDNHTRAIALRSLFGFLKTRRRIFANPARGLPANIGRHAARARATARRDPHGHEAR